MIGRNTLAAVNMRFVDRGHTPERGKCVSATQYDCPDRIASTTFRILQIDGLLSQALPLIMQDAGSASGIGSQEDVWAANDTS